MADTYTWWELVVACAVTAALSHLTWIVPLYRKRRKARGGGLYGE